MVYVAAVKSFPELIDGDRIYLKKHDLTIVDEMFQLIENNRDRLSQFMPWALQTQRPEDTKGYIVVCLESWKQKALFDYGIYLKSGHRFIGNAGIHSIDWRNSRCELGYWLGLEFEGKGYTTEAVHLIEKACFEKNFHRIEIRCSADNVKSSAVAIRSGYKLEGYLRDEKIEQNRYRDTLIFSKLKSELKQNSFVTLLGLEFTYLFVNDMLESKNWYEKLFNIKPDVNLDNYVEFRLGSAGFALYLADSKSPASTGGSVGYWRVVQFEKTINLFIENGATVYREPISLPNLDQICQVKDPFGNIIGLIG